MKCLTITIGITPQQVLIPENIFSINKNKNLLRVLFSISQVLRDRSGIIFMRLSLRIWVKNDAAPAPAHSLLHSMATFCKADKIRTS
jgi:hypothetical protein